MYYTPLYPIIIYTQISVLRNQEIRRHVPFLNWNPHTKYMGGPEAEAILSLSRALRIFAEKRTALKRETRREHAPPLNNISVPVVHHTSK